MYRMYVPLQDRDVCVTSWQVPCSHPVTYVRRQNLFISMSGVASLELVLDGMSVKP